LNRSGRPEAADAGGDAPNVSRINRQSRRG
jgi:hypothetical protein